MKRAHALPASVALCALAACANSGDMPPPGGYAANPTALIAAEISLARLAQQKGQGAALRDTAAEGAELFLPSRTPIAALPEGRAADARGASWQPYAAWVSCDGSYGVTEGGMQTAQGNARFATVWQRQKNGTFRWVLGFSVPTAQPLIAPEMLAGKVADCTRGAGRAPAAPGAAITDEKWGRADDMTLQWVSGGDSAAGYSLSVLSWNGKGFDNVLTLSAPPRPVD